MPIHAISPAFVVINYHSPWGQHTRTIPTLGWNPDAPGDPGTFETHDATGIEADVMVETLIDAISGNNDADIVHDAYTIFTVPTDDNPPIPQFTRRYASPGTETLTGQSQAVQCTFTFRTTFGNSFRFVQLDRAGNNQWGNFYTLQTTEIPIVTEISSVANGWAGRDGGRPYAWLNTSVSLNKRLRAKYDMI